MKRRLYTILVIAACFFTGCGTGSAAEKSMDGYAAEADPDTPVISEETKKTSSGETEVMESIKSESTDDTDTAAGVYDGILDMFYYKILEGWDLSLIQNSEP
ncbi:MAG: hypothetical protein K2G55_08975, partial [Lachnospiraceae bacterium]|nr:hypothetical protein [Lachnospiraceae bacterium]